MDLVGIIGICACHAPNSNFLRRIFSRAWCFRASWASVICCAMRGPEVFASRTTFFLSSLRAASLSNLESLASLSSFLRVMACCRAPSSAAAADFSRRVSSSNLACRSCTSRQFFSPWATLIAYSPMCGALPVATDSLSRLSTVMSLTPAAFIGDCRGDDLAMVGDDAAVPPRLVPTSPLPLAAETTSPRCLNGCVDEIKVAAFAPPNSMSIA
mmetsp:Transcript_9868/g.19397  ORF Transcript_9868/g.19397 Transcript_9868/m.19397 type:complete len:213 (-) Transcript_9868:215-853(-)